MRTIVGIMLVTCLGAPASAWAGERDKALAVIERAVKAHGGASALTKAPIRTRSGQGVIGLSGDRPFTTEETVRFPDRCRVVLDVGRERLIVVLNGDKGWMQAGGTTQEMKKAEFAERREELYVWWLMTLVPLQKDGFDLKPLADAKVGDQEAAVVKVSSKGFPDATLFFDKKTNLLIKIARPATEAGIPVRKEYLFTDHKDFDGVKMPSKQIDKINGTKLSEVKFTSYKFLTRIEDAAFTKP
jgi:hypothetical protein